MPVAIERPRLRPQVGAAKDDRDPRFVFLWDQERWSPRQPRLTWLEFRSVQLFDGQRSLPDIQAEVMRLAGGQQVPLEWLHALVGKIDAALLLESPRFREYLHGPVREPACIGCYEADPETLRRQLRGIFTAPGAPGLPFLESQTTDLRAALLPHIDYDRGGVSFAWGFKEIYERTKASLFVIVGTSHYSAHRFTITRKHFQTPLGIVPTDQRYVDRLVEHYGEGLFDDEMAAHLPEHSIELEVVFLQFLYENRRPIRIVPLVVGSFQDCMVGGLSAPSAQTHIRRMIDALRRVEDETDEPICYIISGDLAHIGPKFGDARMVEEPWLSQSRAWDQKILQRAEGIDADGYYRIIADEDDRRRICGLPPTYTVLEALRPRMGRLLHYDQYVDRSGFESVSFASMGFYR